MKIVTLTLNPAFDLHCYIENFRPYHENLADFTNLQAGGKGINIAKALTLHGIEQTAIVLLGEENKDTFESALQKSALRYLGISVPGRIRENITLHTKNAEETRISFRGFRAGKEALEKVEAELAKLCAGDIVTLTGRNPEGMQIADVKDLCARLRSRKIRTVIDSRSFSLEDLLEAKPWLIKPNQEEISAYLGKEITSLEEVKSAAAALHRKGIENVMVSLGAKGALLTCKEGCFQVCAPKIDAVSTVGAGDSSIAGFLAAFREGCEKSECLRRAVAYGTAACLTSGTCPPAVSDVENLQKNLSKTNK